MRAGYSLVQTIRAPEVLDCVHVALETRQYSEHKPVSLAPGRVFAVSASPMPEGGAVVVLRYVTRIEQVERRQRIAPIILLRGGRRSPARQVEDNLGRCRGNRSVHGGGIVQISGDE